MEQTQAVAENTPPLFPIFSFKNMIWYSQRPVDIETKHKEDMFLKEYLFMHPRVQKCQKK